MLLSFALILMLGMFAGWVFQKLHLPSLTGMLLTGVLIGPHCLGLLDSSVIEISSQIRRIALIIILIRAGLNLKLEDLKKVGRPAIMMCFVPASCEILGMMLLAPRLMGLPLIDALVLGTVVAAVSPAVIVPHMLKIMEEGYGTNKGIPQMILAGASADDVFVIVLFTCFTKIAAGGDFEAIQLLRIPTSILLGILGGIVIGRMMHLFVSRIQLDTMKSLILFLSVAFLLVTLEDMMMGTIGFSGLIAVMAMGMSYARVSGNKAIELSKGFSKMWTMAEIFLFVLVGAAVDIGYAFQAGGEAVLLVFGVLVFRMIGVATCMMKTKLNRKERLFCMFAYTPKATVQAAIGAIPLAMGLPYGNMILTVAVISILITAPLGAFLIDLSYPRFLEAAE